MSGSPTPSSSESPSPSGSPSASPSLDMEGAIVYYISHIIFLFEVNL
jgi:hypothetical protein